MRHVIICRCCVLLSGDLSIGSCSSSCSCPHALHAPLHSPRRARRLCRLRCRPCCRSPAAWWSRACPRRRAALRAIVSWPSVASSGSIPQSLSRTGTRRRWVFSRADYHGYRQPTHEWGAGPIAPHPPPHKQFLFPMGSAWGCFSQRDAGCWLHEFLCCAPRSSSGSPRQVVSCCERRLEIANHCPSLRSRMLQLPIRRRVQGACIRCICRSRGVLRLGREPPICQQMGDMHQCCGQGRSLFSLSPSASEDPCEVVPTLASM